MSTRSGKRIHNSFHEITNEADAKIALVVHKTEKKTRNKRLKENVNHLDTDKKLKNNYVSYPSDEDADTKLPVDTSGNRTTRKAKRSTLKEHDNNVADTEAVDSTALSKNNTRRVTRRARNIEDSSQLLESKTVKESVPNLKKGKRSKKNKTRSSDINEPVHTNETVKFVSKKLKKKIQKSDSANTTEDKQKLNQSNISSDSFHSAAGSPSRINNDPSYKHKNNLDVNLELEIQGSITSNTFDDVDTKPKDKSNVRCTVNGKIGTSEVIASKKQLDKSGEIKKKSKKKNKPASNPSSSINGHSDSLNELNSTCGKIDIQNYDDSKIESKSKIRKLRSTRSFHDDENNSLEKPCKTEQNSNKPLQLDNTPNKEASRLNTTFEKPEELNSTFNKSESKLNKTFEKSEELNSTFNKSEPKLNTTFEKPEELNSTFNKSESKLNTTFEKPEELNSTFNKSESKLNTTFDKVDEKLGSQKSSLISSDEGTINVTFDKEDNLRISITSDDSRSENIVNTTPVLIESSIDETQLSTSTISKELSVPNGEEPDQSRHSRTPQPPTTPLRREGTFTKETEDIQTVNMTPTKKMSLPSAGCTPFHVNNSSQTKKSMLNMTRSIEKSPPGREGGRQGRSTRVMFRSPAYDPAAVLGTHHKKRLIKSSLKGSNKSFVFDESGPDAGTSGARGARFRKRSYSYTAGGGGEAGEGGGKRARPAPAQLPRGRLQRSVERLSRPRSLSAHAGVEAAAAAASPCKQAEKRARTQLPDFAALHRKQFQRMESLSDAVLRKQQRARRLLAPAHHTPNTSATNVAGTPKPMTSREPVAKKPETTPKQPQPGSLPANLPTVGTLESLRPGYTRFGFKMNSHVNPFTATPAAAGEETNPKPAKQKTGGKMSRTVSKPVVAVGVSASEASRGARAAAARELARTIIKGVRTNRRFQLQMQMRNMQ